MDAQSLTALVEQGLALLNAGRLQEALEIFEQVLEHKPTHYEGLRLSGKALMRLGRHDESIARIEQALKLRGHSPLAHAALGEAYLAAGRMSLAEESFRASLKLKSDVASVWFGCAYVLAEMGRHEEAIEAYAQAQKHRLSAAASLHFNWANSLRQLYRYEEALAHYDQAILLEPNNVGRRLNRVVTLREMRRYTEALQSIQEAIAMAPDNPKLWKNQADIYQTLQNHEQIIKSLERVVALDSNDAEAHAMLLHTTMQLCDWTDFGSRCGQVKKQLHSASIGGPLILVAMPEINRADMRQAAQQFSRSLPAIGGRMACSGRAYVHERIKLAYLSADFFNHATAYLMAEVFELHDKAAFEVYGLSYFNDKASPMRTRLENAFEHFIDISTWSDGQVAQWMREHEIDIAVDLKGFTARCRFGIFKYKAVPIQVNYLGYPGTLGDECMDYIIGDSWVTPMAHQADYPEKIVQMPHSYQPNDRKRVIDDVTPSRAELGLPEDAFVFCCFNKNYKITPDVLDVWCDILKNVDNGVLWLFTSSQTAQNNLMREVELRGVAAQRLVFAQKAPLAQHLARHRCADLFLDTWPCNAHTTASDALWAGLPVLTCTGETFASRVAASLLDAVGLPKLIVHHPSDYREAAIALAQDTQGLATLRQRLADALLQSPLFDTPLYTRHLEAAYRTMWYRQQQGLVPAAFAVKDVLLSDSKNIRPIDD